MNHWISACAKHHQQCEDSNAATSWLPRRLLEITQSGGALNLRLIDTTGFPGTIQYVALSHMWGDITTSPPLRTFKSNYQAMTMDINLDYLPRNFFDAILVCAKLGAHYLWIDSLCIVQDDPDDWARESVAMHLVYRHALCTVVA